MKVAVLFIDRVLKAILLFIDQILIDLLIYIIIASAIMSWLIVLNVVNPYNPIARTVWNALNAITEPMLRPIRRFTPSFSGIDISPMILILGLFLLRYIINIVLLPMLA